MRDITVKCFYKNSLLSYDKGWEEVYNKLKEYGVIDSTEDTMLDFTGIYVADPHKFYHFKLLMQLDHIYMKFSSLGKAYETIRLMYILDGKSEDHIQNEEPAPVKKLTAQQKKFLSEANRVYDYIKEVDSQNAVIRIADCYTQLLNMFTPVSIGMALERYCEEHKELKEIIVDINDIAIDTGAISRLIDSKIKINKQYGVSIAFDVNDEECIKKIELYLFQKLNQVYNVEDRLEVIKRLKVGTPGILITFKKSRTKDEFGRYGNGEALSSRIAIFNGVRKARTADGQIGYLADFTSFNGNKFYTKEHYALENDGEELKLETYKTSIPLDSLGLGAEFLGSNAHFARPIQESAEESIIMRHMDEDGKVVAQKYTIAERMKAVFDDFNIQYDEEELNNAIKETSEIIG